MHDGIAPSDELRLEFDTRIAELDDDYAFIAECNVGGEFMAPERKERVARIADNRWMRTLDDRIGLSYEEMVRKERTPKQALPVMEKLLSDKEEHIIPRTGGRELAVDNPFGFRLDVPAHAFNLGEVYNLCIARGTLTAEERFKINDHIVQTIIMLEQLPFPKQLKRVPEYAGGHHETLIGTGYPRKLSRDEMSIPARIMAIADVFEALSAADRPYKAPKKLTDCVKIMSFMVKDQHIDSDLFKLFLSSGIYRKYAETYLRPDQIDDVDVSQYLDA